MKGVYLISVLVHVTVENLDKMEREQPQAYEEFLRHFEAAARVLVDADVLPPALAAGLSEKQETT